MAKQASYAAEEYRLPLPYPEVKFLSLDQEDIRMLSEDYAGAVSELTAITRYAHQEGYASKQNEIKEALHGIAIAEMHHLDLLKNAIYTLGGSPKYQARPSREGKYFTADCVSCETLLSQILLSDIEAERAAIAQYSRHAAETQNQSVRRLLNRIISDERLHIKILTQLHKKYF